jgi:hypothetical protein
VRERVPLDYSDFVFLVVLSVDLAATMAIGVISVSRRVASLEDIHAAELAAESEGM